MFDIDNWAEIFSSIRKNKLRTFLTGFSIAWGIFMFVILLATSNGAQNGISVVFEKRTTNIIQIQGRLTSMPYEGLPDRRKINLNMKDYDRLNNRFSEKEYISALIPTEATLSYENNSTIGACTGINAEYNNINGIKIIENQGRLINDLDIIEKRKVAVINERLRDILYKHEDPIGKAILINDSKFTVIGVYRENAIISFEKAYIPFSTAQLLFNGGSGLKSIALTVTNLNTNKENEAFTDRMMANFAELHKFDPNDKVAVNLFNQLKVYLQTVSIINTIVIFIWIIGAGTLFAGMIGVSNIMLITVRERTREFGIRKALGAKPASILQGIIMEAVCLTSLFGYFGLFMGMLVSNLFGMYLKSHPNSTEFAIFENPSINLGVALIAMIVLIIAGVLAGYFPARQAVKITPVAAMREE
ncbi:MAG: ABC transporter permease [Candidatus Azobacteroides sp.]|nr:ABC transporter permease [Candidatus Azobacteroides sp.]